MSDFAGYGRGNHIDFGDYVEYPTGYSREPHIYKVVGSFRSNSYQDPPDAYKSEPTNHGKVVPCLKIIHCGIDETKVIRVRESDCIKIENKINSLRAALAQERERADKLGDMVNSYADDLKQERENVFRMIQYTDSNGLRNYRAEKAEAECAVMRSVLEEVVIESDEWWCPTCKRTCLGIEVTFQEYHEECGTFLGDINTPEWLEKARKALSSSAGTELLAEVTKMRNLLTDIRDFLDNPKKYGGTWPEYYSATIKLLLNPKEAKQS